MNRPVIMNDECRNALGKVEQLVKEFLAKYDCLDNETLQKEFYSLMLAVGRLQSNFTAVVNYEVYNYLWYRVRIAVMCGGYAPSYFMQEMSKSDFDWFYSKYSCNGGYSFPEKVKENIKLLEYLWEKVKVKLLEYN